MDDPMPRCPYSKRGHRISVIVPESSEHPAVLFCDRCFATRHVTFDLPKPMDDLPADAIARITQR